jgi:hypothetical protein
MDAPSSESSGFLDGLQHCSNLLFSKLVNHEHVSVSRGPNAEKATAAIVVAIMSPPNLGGQHGRFRIYRKVHLVNFRIGSFLLVEPPARTASFRAVIKDRSWREIAERAYGPIGEAAIEAVAASRHSHFDANSIFDDAALHPQPPGRCGRRADSGAHD